MPDSNPGSLPQKSGALPMSHHIYKITSGVAYLPGEHRLGLGQLAEYLLVGRGVVAARLLPGPVHVAGQMILRK